MATAREANTEEYKRLTNTCSICLEAFLDPCSLPCNHSFCGICLIGYLRKLLISEGESKHLFLCPLCRSEIRISNYKDLESDDLQQLNQLSFSIGDIGTESRNRVHECCTPCGRGNCNVQASHICRNCNEGLCAECVTHHRRNKMTYMHKVEELGGIIENKESVKYPSEETCNTHMKKYKYLCIDHDSLCCSRCVIEVHRKCLDVQSFPEVIKSSQYTGLVQKIRDFFANIGKIAWDLRQKDSALAERASQFGKAITDMEKELHDEVSNIFCTQRTPVLEKIGRERQTLIDTLKNTEQLNSRISQMTDVFHSVKEGDDARLKTIAFREVRNLLKRENAQTVKLAAALKNTNLRVEIEIEPFLQQFNQKLESAFHRLTSDDCRFIGHRRLGRPKFINSTSVLAKVNEVLFVGNRNIVLATNDVTLTVVDSVSFETVTSVRLSSQATSLTEYEENVVAAALPSEKKIAVLQLTGHTSNASYVETEMPYYCLTSDNRRQMSVLVSCNMEPRKSSRLYYQKIKGGIKKDWTQINSNFYNVNKMCVDGSTETIYITQYRLNKINGIDFQGHTKFTFSHHQLHMPLGVFLGAPDKIHVCSYATQQVNEITPSTRRLTDKLCGVEGLKGPIWVAFNRARTKCVVYDNDTGKELKIFDM